MFDLVYDVGRDYWKDSYPLVIMPGIFVAAAVLSARRALKKQFGPDEFVLPGTPRRGFWFELDRIRASLAFVVAIPASLIAAIMLAAFSRNALYWRPWFETASVGRLKVTSRISFRKIGTRTGRNPSISPMYDSNTQVTGRRRFPSFERERRFIARRSLCQNLLRARRR
jgi:hypothetical protein